MANIVSAMCRRAAASGFPRCMNRIQNMATAHAERMANREKVESLGFIADAIADLFDGWLAVEHHDVWEKVEYERAKAETVPTALVGDDMQAVMDEMVALGI